MHGLKAKLRQNAPIPINADLECAPGELLALVGPSGSGKSTILRSIAGLYAPLEAEVTVDGEVWSNTATAINVPTWRRPVGIVFQSYGLFPHLTAVANVESAMTHLALTNRSGRAAGLVALVNPQGLEHLRLFGTKVTFQGVKQLPAFPRLKVIEVSRDQVPPETEFIVRSRFPGIQIRKLD